MRELQLVATAAFGLEAVVAREVRALGYEPVVEPGRVAFTGDALALARANLWLRTADRVLVQVGRFEAPTFDALFDGTRALPWAELLPEDAAFPVEGKSHRSTLTSVPACQGVVKKAIAEALAARHHRKTSPETGATFPVRLVLLRDVATLLVDASGEALHRRGYRKLGAAAPLKETLAAGLVLLSRWDADRILVDPMCGSGTIPIEAAWIGLDRAPGRLRAFLAEKWPWVGAAPFAAARAEADDRARPTGTLRAVFGSDADGEVLSLARYHARLAGVEGVVHFERKPVSEFRTKQKYGLVVTNPPYGGRLGGAADAVRDLAKAMAALPTWSCHVLSPDLGIEEVFGKRATRKRKLYNGTIRCDFTSFLGPRPPGRAAEEAEVPEEA